MKENKGDLISRKVLKEKIENLIGYSLSYEAMLNAIDNAPTVEGEILTEEAYSDLCLRASRERPQGKWIDIDSLVSKAVCSNCKNIIITEPFGKPNYCPNCGAKMEVKDD